MSHQTADSDGSIRLDWDIAIGFTNRLQFTFTDEDAVAFPVTAYTYSIQAWRPGQSPSTAANLILNYTQGSQITNNGAAGTVDVLMSVADSELFKNNVDVLWRVRAVHPNGDVRRWYNGFIKPSRELHEGTTTGVTQALNIDGVTVNTTVTIAAGGASGSSAFADLTGSPSDNAALVTYVALKQSFLWYNVKDYGAIGDGVADDTAAFIATVTAIPDKGGVMWLPAGNYLLTNVIDIQKNVIIRGAGREAFKFYTLDETPFFGASTIRFNHATRNCLYFNRSVTNVYPVWGVEDITIKNVASTTPSAGAGITFNGGGQFNLDRVTIDRFYIDLDVVSALFWKCENTNLIAPIAYAARVDSGGSLDSDVGGWVFDKCNFLSGFITPTTSIGLYWKGSGAGMVINSNFNAQTELDVPYEFDYGIVVDFSGGISSDIIFDNLTFENIRLGAMRLTGGAANVNITNIEMNVHNATGSTLSAIYIDDYDYVVIDNIIGRNGGAVAYPMIDLRNINYLRIGQIIGTDYNAPYTLTSCTNVNVAPTYDGFTMSVGDATTLWNSKYNFLGGSMGIQSVAQTGSWLHQNALWNGTGYRYLYSGFAASLHMTVGDFIFKNSPTGTSPNTFTYTDGVTFKQGTAANTIYTNSTGVGFGIIPFTFGHFDKSQAAATNVFITNNHASNGAIAAIRVGVDPANLGNSAYLAIYGTGTTVSGRVGPKVTTLEANAVAALLINNRANAAMVFMTNNTERMHITGDGYIAIGTGYTPSARLHLAPGLTGATLAPLKFTTGSLMTTPEAAAMEYNNTFHLTNSDATRRHIVLAASATKTTAGAPYTNDGFVTVNIGGTDVKLMTTA